MVKYLWENRSGDIYLKPGITEKTEGEQSYLNTIKLFEGKNFINNLLKLLLKKIN